jgi:DNA-binding LytR/AlgR family response regulator
MRSSLSQFLDRVEPGLFVRVHRGWLVKRSSITELSTRGPGTREVVLRNGRRLPAGRVYLKELRRALHGPAPARPQQPVLVH